MEEKRRGQTPGSQTRDSSQSDTARRACLVVTCALMSFRNAAFSASASSPSGAAFIVANLTRDVKSRAILAAFRRANFSHAACTQLLWRRGCALPAIASVLLVLMLRSTDALSVLIVVLRPRAASCSAYVSAATAAMCCAAWPVCLRGA